MVKVAARRSTRGRGSDLPGGPSHREDSADSESKCMIAHDRNHSSVSSYRPRSKPTGQCDEQAGPGVPEVDRDQVDVGPPVVDRTRQRPCEVEDVTGGVGEPLVHDRTLLPARAARQHPRDERRRRQAHHPHRACTRRPAT